MPQQKGSKLYNQFVRGLITEATALTYPENASFDEQNFELLRKGSRRRRRGTAKNSSITAATFAEASINYEDIINGAFSKFKWNAAGGIGTNNFYIIQIGDKLLIWDEGSLLETINLSTYAVDVTRLSNSKCQYDTGKGYLFVVNPFMEPIYVKYDTTTSTFSVQQITINIRDIKGLDDGLAVDERPTTLSNAHYYNLLNQGWSSANVVSLYARHPIHDVYHWSTATGVNYSSNVYPSNADVIFYGKIESSGTPTNIGRYSGFEVFKYSFGSTPAAKGRYILNAFNIDRAAQVTAADVNNKNGGSYGYPSVSPIVVDERPKTIAFYAGRAWWSGIENIEYAGTLLATKIIESESDIGKCYQVNDPTAEDLNEVLDSDGVVIPIPEAGEILKLVTLNENLLVFATNGVWALTGIDGSFTATGYTLNKISSSGALSASSIVEVENSILYWGASGVFILQPDKVTGYLTPESLSINTIQTFYDTLPPISKFRVDSIYDNKEKRVIWYYNTEETSEFSDANWGSGNYSGIFTNALVFDTTLTAFSKWKFSSPSTVYPIFNSVVLMEALNSSSRTDDIITVGGDVVQVGGDDVIIFETNTLVADIEQLIFTVDGEAEIVGFSKYSNDINFHDFYNWSQTSESDCYLETGSEINDTVLQDSQIVYLASVFDRTEFTYTVSGGVASWDNQSGCKVRAKWDWYDANNGKWSSQWDAYKLEGNFNFDDSSDGTKPYTGGQTVTITKHKLRGKGYAVQLRYDVDAEKDCKLLGWQIVGEGRTAV